MMARSLKGTSIFSSMSFLDLLKLMQLASMATTSRSGVVMPGSKLSVLFW